jgi:hypothetical protein
MVCVRREEWLEVHMTLVGPVRRRKTTNGGTAPDLRAARKDRHARVRGAQ